METWIFLLFGMVISCLINTIIIFQFMDEHYNRVYQKKYYYNLTEIMVCISLVMVNSIGIPLINIFSWMLIFNLIVIFLYTENQTKFIKRIFEVTGLILLLSICETIGYWIFEFVLWKFEIDNIPKMMLRSIDLTFSKLIVIIFYYLIISRIWKSKRKNSFTKNQYLVHIIMIIYSIVNITVIIIVISSGMVIDFEERLLLLINLFCIVFADMYIIYFTRFTEENSQLKLELGLLEQQSDLQYRYYLNQEEKYNESIKILHDVNKHLDIIKDTYKLNRIEDAEKYTDEINKILEPLVLKQYTNNPTLDIILNDRKRCANTHKIDFDMDIGYVDLSFMNPIEVTTVFGNLLDNAIEGCNRASLKEKKKNMKLNMYNDFIVVNITNTSDFVSKWSNGKPITHKGEKHGIGLINVENVVDKYNGNLILEEKEGLFMCNIIFNA